MLLVLTGLVVSVVVVAFVGLIAFGDVAFHAPEYSAAGVSTHGRRLPRRQPELFRWCSATAQCLARGWYAARRVTASAGRSVPRPPGATDQIALDPVSAACCSALTGVTPLEVLEIEQYLYRTQPPDQVEEIRRRATENSREVAQMIRKHTVRPSVRCPLACEDGTCAAYPVRPVQCRVRCALFGHVFEDADDAYRTRLIIDGTEHGITEAMNEAGLDTELRELNSALAKALAPSEKARSSNEERHFEECIPYAATAT